MDPHAPDPHAPAFDHFREATACDEATARFFLESAGWDVGAALGAFFDAGTEAHPPPVGGDGPPGRKEKPASQAASDEGANASEDEDEDWPETLDDADADADDTSDAPLGQRLFDSAETAAAPPPSTRRSAEPASPQPFMGAGYSLARGLIEPDATPPLAPGKAPAGAPGAEDELTSRTVRLTFWQDGFQLDDGPLRNVTDEANRLFLKMLESKVLPPELRQLDERGRPVRTEIQLVDRRRHAFVPPPVPRFTAFAGAGRALGGSSEPAEGEAAPSITLAPSPLAPTAGSASAGRPGDPAAPPHEPSLSHGPSLTVVDSEPSTTLQVRLADGSRLRIRLNLSHTVAQLYTVVAQAAAGTRARQRLLAGFPPKELLDLSQTIGAAGLQGAVVVQVLA